MTPLNARELSEALIIDMAVKNVPFIKGSPGIGKTAVVHKVGKEANLIVKTEHMSMKEPTDVQGMPDISGEYSVFKSFENFPTEEMKVPEGTNGWLLFLDEINSASIETQAACYSLILDRKVGSKKLHPDCYVVAAGNLKTDNAIVNTQSSAMTSRMVNYEMRFDHEVFMEDVVLKDNWDVKLAAYLEWKPEHAHNFVPSRAEDPYACPRTWEMQQKRMAVQEDWEWVSASGNKEKGFNYEAKHNRAAAEGLLGTEIGREFITFCRTFGQLPSTADVLADPHGVRLPESRGLRFALVSQLRRDVDGQTLSDIYDCIMRLDEKELHVAFLRGLMTDTSKKISRAHPVIQDAMRNLRRR